MIMNNINDGHNNRIIIVAACYNLSLSLSLSLPLSLPLSPSLYRYSVCMYTHTT